MNEYEKQANDFLNKVGATITAEFKRNGKHFANDTEVRDIYSITIKRGSRSYTFDFGQSINKSQYYQDSIAGRTYTKSGKARTGNYSITDLQKYQSGGQKLKLVAGENPTNYDILACLTKYDPGTFQDFCREFGYDEDSRTAERVYKSVVDEWRNVAMLFNDSEIELLQEIQ